MIGNTGSFAAFLGVLLGLGGLRLLASLDSRDLVQVTWLHCFEVTVLAASVSAAFAFVPAYRASRLDPVEALKAE